MADYTMRNAPNLIDSTIDNALLKAQVKQETGISETDLMSQKSITDLLNGKVSVEEGKGLSSNDYTDEDKATISSIGDIPTVVQTTGQSTTDVMSQKAVTNAIENTVISEKDVYIYVDETGSDNGDGSIDNPYKTLFKATSSIPKLVTGDYTITIAENVTTPAYNITISNIGGGGEIKIINESNTFTISSSLYIGDCAISLSITDVPTNSVTIMSCCGAIELNNMVIPTSSGNVVTVSNSSNVILNNVTFGGTLVASIGSNVTLTSCTFSNAIPESQKILLMTSCVVSSDKGMDYYINRNQITAGNGSMLIHSEGIYHKTSGASEVVVVQDTGQSTTSVMSQKAVTDELADKVTVVSGKELSSNDYTDEDKLSVNNVGKIFDTTSNIPIYVSVTGSDETGDGSQENPYLTIQHAVDTIPKVLNYVVRIIIGGGTYTENVLISNITGAGQLYIIGLTSSRVTLSGSLIMVTSNLSRVDIRNLTISSESTKVLEFYCVSASEIKVSDCVLTRLNSNNGTNALDVNLSSLVTISDCEINSTRYGVQVSSGRLLIGYAVTINSSDENLHMFYGGQIVLMQNSPGDFTFDKNTGGQLIAPNGTITI